MPRSDDELDMLAEIVTHPGWRTLKTELAQYLSGITARVLTPAESEFDLVRKEADTKSMRALQDFFGLVEHKVKQFHKRA